VLVDKPEGITSHDVVQRVRRALRIRAAGHTGTLDPFATGLLVVLVGRATRLARFVEGQVKGYRAVARLGVRTDTDDRTGTVLEQRPIGGLTADGVRRALEGFVGSGSQRPPVFSAKHVGGERSHRLARRGAPVEPAEVPVTVFAVEWLGWSPPEVTFRVTVSAGTYIRALARDLGERLGVGGHLTALRRESIGSLRVDDAVPLDRVGPEAVLPPSAVLPQLTPVPLDDAARRDAVHGRVVPDQPGAGGGADLVRLMAGEELVAVARRGPTGWQPVVVLGTP
jgi:tRNA pseudouridine55 synthase